MTDNGVGGRIREARVAAGMSQRRLSSISGVPQQTITRLETGLIRPRLDTVEKLANALGASMNSLLGATPTALSAQEEQFLEVLRAIPAEQHSKLLDWLRSVVEHPPKSLGPGPKK